MSWSVTNNNLPLEADDSTTSRGKLASVASVKARELVGTVSSGLGDQSHEARERVGTVSSGLGDQRPPVKRCHTADTRLMARSRGAAKGVVAPSGGGDQRLVISVSLQKNKVALMNATRRQTKRKALEQRGNALKIKVKPGQVDAPSNKGDQRLVISVILQKIKVALMNATRRQTKTNTVGAAWQQRFTRGWSSV